MIEELIEIRKKEMEFLQLDDLNTVNLIIEKLGKEITHLKNIEIPKSGFFGIRSIDESLISNLDKTFVIKTRKHINSPYILKKHLKFHKKVLESKSKLNLEVLGSGVYRIKNFTIFLFKDERNKRNPIILKFYKGDQIYSEYKIYNYDEIIEKIRDVIPDPRMEKANRAVAAALSAQLIYDDMEDIYKEKLEKIISNLIAYEKDEYDIMNMAYKKLDSIFVIGGGQTETIINEFLNNIKIEVLIKLIKNRRI